MLTLKELHGQNRVEGNQTCSVTPHAKYFLNYILHIKLYVLAIHLSVCLKVFTFVSLIFPMLGKGQLIYWHGNK